MIKHRIQYIDRLKGFAILAVVLGHLCNWQLGGYHSPSWFVNTFHMATFLFLSGMVITPPNLSKVCGSYYNSYCQVFLLEEYTPIIGILILFFFSGVKLKWDIGISLCCRVITF